MRTQAITLKQTQRDIIQMARILDDQIIANKIKKYMTKLLYPKNDPLYSPENLEAIRQSYEEYKQGKSTVMTSEQLHEFLFGDEI